eukprot:SAG11_NODE_407_length_9712_cov_11.569437_6_plen_755_part_00
MLNCSAGMLDTSRPFEVNGSWYIITEYVAKQPQDLNGSQALMARWRDTTNGSFMGWEYDGILFTPRTSDWAGKDSGTKPNSDCSGSAITDLECPDFFAPPSSVDGADQTAMWVVSGGRSMNSGGSWACRYLCTAAGCPASIAENCQTQPSSYDWARAWEGEGSRRTGAGNKYATGHLDETMRLQVVYNSTYDFGTFYAAKTGAISTGGGNTGSGRHLLFGWVYENYCAMDLHSCPNHTQSNTSFHGVLSMPREVTISAAGKLSYSPPCELQGLRLASEHHSAKYIMPAAPVVVETRGWSVEIFAGFEADPSASAEVYGVQIMSSEDLESEATFVGYNATCGRAYIDLRNATLGSVGMRWVWTAPLTVQARHGLALRVYVDRSTIELFAGQWVPSDNSTAWEDIKFEQMITARAYVSQESSDRIALYSHGAAVVATQAHIFRVGTGDFDFELGGRDGSGAGTGFREEGSLRKHSCSSSGSGSGSTSVPIKSDDCGAAATGKTRLASLLTPARLTSLLKKTKTDDNVASLAVDWPSFLGKHDLRWDFRWKRHRLPQRKPMQSCEHIYYCATSVLLPPARAQVGLEDGSRHRQPRARDLDGGRLHRQRDDVSTATTVARRFVKLHRRHTCCVNRGALVMVKNSSWSPHADSSLELIFAVNRVDAWTQTYWRSAERKMGWRRTPIGTLARHSATLHLPELASVVAVDRFPPPDRGLSSCASVLGAGHRAALGRYRSGQRQHAPKLARRGAGRLGCSRR